MPDEHVHDVSQSNMPLNENPTGNTFNNEVMTVQGPMGDDDEIELQKAWTMEMLMNNGDILTTTMNGLEQASMDYKKPLYARATHSNHVIQYYRQQILERQKVVNEYRSMIVDRIDETPLESNLYKSDPAVISHIIHMIEEDNFWHQKTFEVVLANLQRSHNKEIHEQENETLHCTENYLCSDSWTTTSIFSKGEQSRKQENHDMEESKTITRLESKNRPEKDHQAGKTEEIEAAMMCWENLEGSLLKTLDKVTDNQEG